MYFRIVGSVIQDAVARYADNHEQSVDEVLQQIDGHLETTSNEYWQDQPAIPYNQLLCRLGYLYTYVPLNATLFEKVLSRSQALKQTLEQASGGTLRVCAMGGGPGTELLGLAKCLLHRSTPPPHQIRFTIFDKIGQWSETWGQIAAAVEEEFASSPAFEQLTPPTVTSNFQSMDVLVSSSYLDFELAFRNADIIVFNYLFSEHKANLHSIEVQEALKALATKASPACAFVVIDRLEQASQLTEGIVNLFKSTFNVEPDVNTLGGIVDGDEQRLDIGEFIHKMKRKPRIQFQTVTLHLPTVFWFVIQRG